MSDEKFAITRLEDITSLDNLPDEFSVECPFCPSYYQDGKRKLNVNMVKNVYHCWRCNQSGTANKLLAKFSPLSRSEIIEITFNPSFKRDVDKLLQTDNNLKVEIFDYNNLTNKIIENSLYNAKLYLNARGITDEEIEYYDIRVGKNNNAFRKRILVPTYDDFGNVVYFVARDYVNKDTNKKYLNSPGSNKSIHVWNLNNVKENDTVIIAEGCFSGISANRSKVGTAVCTFGKFMSDYQAKLIADKHPIEIILSLDGDVPENEIAKNILILRKFYNGKITYLQLPDKKDPNDLTLEEYEKCIEERRSSTKLESAKMRYKQDFVLKF